MNEFKGLKSFWTNGYLAYLSLFFTNLNINNLLPYLLSKVKRPAIICVVNIKKAINTKAKYDLNKTMFVKMQAETHFQDW